MNVGMFDRVLRAVLGLALIVLPLMKGDTFALFATPWIHWGAIVVGVILLLTATFSFCPLYRLMGCSTRR